jgi:hypothetical protein
VALANQVQDYVAREDVDRLILKRLLHDQLFTHLKAVFDAADALAKQRLHNVWPSEAEVKTLLSKGITSVGKVLKSAV